MKTKIFATSILAIAGTALAQPGAFTDLGNRTTTQVFSQDVTLLSASDIQWFRVVLPPVATNTGWVDIWTSAVGDITDTEIGLYTAAGNGATPGTTYNDDDSGPLTFSQLTFGSTVERASLGGNALPRNGSDGVLAGGEYYLAVGRYTVAFAGNFGVVGTYTGTQRTTQVTFDIGEPTEPLPPSASGAVSTLSAAPGDQLLFTVTVAPGANPISTGIVVVGDFQPIGGSAAVAFHDDGLNGDVSAGDGVYSSQYIVPEGVAGGGYTVAVTVSDAQGRSGGTSISGSIFNPENLGPITTDVTVNNTVPPATGLWYRFTVTQAASAASLRFFDIDTNGSDIDTEIALFNNASGQLIAENDDGGVGADSVLSFGSGGGTAQTDGGSGSTGANGTLAAGTYLLCVAQYNSTFASGPTVTFPVAGAGGAIVLTFSSGQVGPFTAPEATDLGGIGAGAGGSEVVTTIDVPVSAGTITWYKFTTSADALNGSTSYMDIDTEPSSPDGTPTVGSINDTELGIYTSSGGTLAIDDDSGSGFHSQLSFGDNVNLRPPFGNGLPGDGGNGDLAAATYYLAVGNYNSVFAVGFNATSASTVTGTVQLNFRTNIPGGGPAGPCSLADLGVAGGLPGQDRLLNNNDFIAFIAYFFAQNPAADLGIAGGLPGSDGQWNNNDFIAFIAHFFADGAGCNG